MQTEAWEGQLVEAPVMVKRDGTYLVFYSANDYGSEQYAVGVASAPSITGPYAKEPEPLLSTASTDGRYLGPGGQDVLSTSDGDLIFFHGWNEHLHVSRHAQRATAVERRRADRAAPVTREKRRRTSANEWGAQPRPS